MQHCLRTRINWFFRECFRAFPHNEILQIRWLKSDKRLRLELWIAECIPISMFLLRSGFSPLGLEGVIVGPYEEFGCLPRVVSFCLELRQNCEFSNVESGEIRLAGRLRREVAEIESISSR